jgi:hypothetical protein
MTDNLLHGHGLESRLRQGRGSLWDLAPLSIIVAL